MHLESEAGVLSKGAVLAGAVCFGAMKRSTIKSAKALELTCCVPPCAPGQRAGGSSGAMELWLGAATAQEMLILEGDTWSLLGHSASRLSHLAQDPAVTPHTCQALHGPRGDDDDDEGMGCSWSEHWRWVLTWDRTGRIWPCVRGLRMQRSCYISIPNVPQPQLQRCWREKLTFLWS